MVTIVVGGQQGSEAKAKTAVHLTKKYGCDLAIRSGGRNAGHTVYINGTKYVTRQLPGSLAVPDVPLAIAAGGMLDVDLLFTEIRTIEGMGINVSDRLMIDPFTTVMEVGSDHREKEMGMNNRLGSTQTGVGVTQADRVMRRAMVAKDVSELERFIGDVAGRANQIADDGGHVLIEGTQGFGLDLYHGGSYPFATSRATCASGFAAEVGISPRLVTDIWLVIRTKVIRVAGNSGPMFQEIDWATVGKECGATEDLTEMTSVTKRVRRVGRFDWDLLARAIMINRPTRIAVSCLDYINYADRGKTDFYALSDQSRAFLLELQVKTGVKVGMVATGPHQDELIDLDNLRNEDGSIPIREYLAKEAEVEP